MTEDSQKSYRQIFKATSIFGGVQVFNIIVGILKTKIIAILLGPAGVGIISLYNSTIQLLNQATGLGIDQSGVRDVAEAYGSGDEDHISKTVTVIRRFVWLTGILGALICIVLAESLSRWTFGNEEYVWAFYALSGVLLFTQLGNGQSLLLRGTRQVKKLARASIIGAVLGLLVSVPLYYFYGEKGIVPSLLLSALFVAVVYWYFARNIRLKKVKLTLNQTFTKGSLMMKLGFMLMLSSFLGSLIMYIIRVFISNNGGVDEVGLFTACFLIIETYVGMVFTAMGTDFYPRLSAINKENQKLTEQTNYQIIISLLIIVPLIVVFMAFAPYLLKILYSDKFIAISLMLQLAIIGILFRVASWAMSYIILAKAKTKIYFIKESCAGCFMLIAYLVSYHYYGLLGIAFGFIMATLFHFIICFIIVRKMVHFHFFKESMKIYTEGVVCCIGVFLALFFLEGWWKYGICTLGIIAVLFKSYWELNKRIDIKGILYNHLKCR